MVCSYDLTRLMTHDSRGKLINYESFALCAQSEALKNEHGVSG